VPGAGLHRQLGMLEETGIPAAFPGGSPTSYSPASNRPFLAVSLPVGERLGHGCRPVGSWPLRGMEEYWLGYPSQEE
jgi:hypothetical protein